MKKQVLTIIALLSFIFTLAIAGSVTGRMMTIDIPFDFTVGNKSLPAGHYTIERVNGGVESLAIHCNETNTSVMTLTYSGKSIKEETPASLVFRHYGDTYFLTEVWEQGRDAARQLPQSSAERAFQKKRSHLSDVAQAEIITIVAQKSN